MWFIQTEEKIIKKGLQKIKYTYEDQRLYGEKILEKIAILKEEDILSSNLPFNNDIPINVREKINSFSEKVGEQLFNIATDIQNLKFAPTEKSIRRAELDNKNQERYSKLRDAFKELYVSYETIIISISILEKINEKVIFEIEKAEGREKTELMILNGIIVYEMTNIIIELINHYKTSGKDALKNIQNEVLSDFENIKKSDDELSEKAEMIQSDISENIEHQIEERNKIKDIVDSKWLKIWNLIHELESRISMTKEYVLDLILIRDNSKSHIMALNSINMEEIVKTNLKKFSEISKVTNIQLSPLSKENVFDLLGLKRNYEN